MSTHQPASPQQSRAPRGGRGALVPIAVLVLGLLEVTVLVAIGVNSSLWWAVLIVVIGWVVGIALLVAAGQQSFVRLRSLIRAVSGRGKVQDHLSRPAFTLLAALLFFFPGLISDVLAIVLLLTPVQRRAVRAIGLGSGSEAARTVLYRRSGGVIEGEIVIDAQGGDPSQPRRREDGTSPPTITQG